jgi:hypothetical protein
VDGEERHVANDKGKRLGPGWKALRASGDDALGLTVQYIRQETLEPLQGIGRYVLYGVAGSVCIAFGVVLLLISVLRLLQTETGAFHGNLSWIPYLIVTILGAAIVGVAAWRITAGQAKRKRSSSEGAS